MCRLSVLVLPTPSKVVREAWLRLHQHRDWESRDVVAQDLEEKVGYKLKNG